MTHASLTHTGLIKIKPPPSFTALDKSQGLWQQIESSKSLCELHTILQKPEAETQAGFSRCERNLNMGFSETASIKPTNQLSASTTHNLPAHCPTTCSILCAKLNNTILDALKFYKLKKKRFWCTVFCKCLNILQLNAHLHNSVQRLLWIIILADIWPFRDHWHCSIRKPKMYSLS